MSFSLTWLPKILKEAGLKVATVDGWETRGHGDVGEIMGVICHHTAGPPTGNMPSLRVVTDGRADLPGPLAQLCLGRDGTYYVVAAGKCYHAGKGEWRGYKTGNTNFIGIEAENMGTHKDLWPEIQMDAYRHGVSAILKYIGQAPIMCAGHKEYAPGRKPDPLFDMGQFRAAIAAIMKGTTPGLTPIPRTEPESQQEGARSPRPTLRRGSTGELVMQVQEKVGVATDGDFGPKTEAMVRAFQRTHGLVPDGIVGPRTWTALDGRSDISQWIDPGIFKSQSTDTLRRLWREFECAEEKMVLIPFGPDKIRVSPPTVPGWEALAAVFQHHGYKIRTTDTDSYNCRSAKGSNKKSLHSFGIALDINWTTNPFKEHEGSRLSRFSEKETQEERADDVRSGQADTDMTLRMIKDVLAIQTKNSKRVFEWGGNWSTIKDAMHFQINVAPDDLATGIDLATVVGWEDQIHEDAGSVFLVSEDEDNPSATTADIGIPHRVVTPSGLRLRSGPGQGFAVIRTIANSEVVYVLSKMETWAEVSLEEDGYPEGYMSAQYLSPLAEEEMPVSPPALKRASIVDTVTVEQIAKIFPVTKKQNIADNWPLVCKGLRDRGLTDRSMVLMALATIRAETEGFLPISEGISRFNTRATPFDMYEKGTPKGIELGNTQAGDGPHFKGRGYVQLTGRFNYNELGQQLQINLVSNPDLANDPRIAGLILAQFLKNKERKIRSALTQSKLKEARKLVNGGSHGFDRFKDAYNRGLIVLA